MCPNQFVHWLPLQAALRPAEFDDFELPNVFAGVGVEEGIERLLGSAPLL